MVDDWHNGFDVGTGGDFWNDSAVFFVDIDLRDDDVGQNICAVFDDGSGGFVTGAFDAKNFHCVNIIDLANKCISFHVYMVFYEICALFQIKYNGIFYYINYKDERNGFISSNRAKIIFEEIKSNIRKTRYLVKSNSLI